MLISLFHRPKLSRSMAAVIKPRTAADVWDDGHADAMARRGPANVWPSGSKLAGAYERGFMAGVAARGFDSG